MDVGLVTEIFEKKRKPEDGFRIFSTTGMAIASSEWTERYPGRREVAVTISRDGGYMTVDEKESGKIVTRTFIPLDLIGWIQTIPKRKKLAIGFVRETT